MHLSAELEAGWRLEVNDMEDTLFGSDFKRKCCSSPLNTQYSVTWFGKMQIVFMSDHVAAQNLLPLFLKLTNDTSFLFLSLRGTILVQLSPLQ